MKAELMIGDWVYNTHNRQNEQVAEIGSGLVMLAYNDLYEYDEIEPIPLTPDILEKNGFSENYREDDLSYAQSCGDVIGIHILGKGGIMDEMYFKYVHQLQHALRLCGIEKEIKL